jgi:hypothetical protein
MTREELIAALESATGPDRGLDADIAMAVQAWPDGAFIMRGAPGMIGLDGGRCVSAPAYTSSIDAALTLVPEGYRWSADCTGPKPYFRVWRMGRNVSRMDADAEGATPALALAAAALRAQGGGA